MSENIGRYNVILELITKQAGDIEKIKKESTGLQGVFNRAKGAFAGIVAAQVVNSALTNIQSLVSSSIGLAANFETTSQSFATLLGDIDAAKTLISELNEFSVATPFEPTEIQNSAKTLLGFGRSAKEVKQDIELIGNASAATGADLQSLAVVFGQVAGIGKLQGQDALQFINQGVPIYQLLAENLGVSVSEVKKLQEQGEITFDILRDSFEKASQEGGKFNGALEAQSKTLNGLISTVRGNYAEVLKNVGTAILPAIKPVVEQLNGLLVRLVEFVKSNEENITEFFDNIISFFKSTFEVVTPIVGGLGRALFVTFSVLKDTFDIIRESKESIIALGAAIVALNTGLAINAANSIRATIALRAKAAAALYNTRVMQGLNAAWRANPIGLVVTAVAALVIGFVQLYKRSERVRNITAGVVNVFKEFYKSVVNLISGVKDLFGDGFLNGLSNIGTQIKDKLITSFKDIFSDFQDIVSGEDIKGGLLRLGQKILKFTPLGWMLELGKKVRDAFVSGLTDSEIAERAKKITDQLNKQREEQEKDLEKSIKKIQEIGKKQRENAGKDESNILEEKKKTQEEINKELYAQQEELVRKNYALRELEARNTIKDAEELKIELERLELDKQIALLRIKRDYAKEGSADAIELENQILELEQKFNALFTRPQIDAFELLPTSVSENVKKQANIIKEELDKLIAAFNSVSDPRIKEDLKRQIDDLTAQLGAFKSPQLNKIIFEQEGFEAIDIANLIPQDRLPALRNRLNNVTALVQAFRDKIKSGNGDPLDLDALDNLEEEGNKIIEYLRRLGVDIPELSEKVISGSRKVLGLSQEEITLLGDSISVARDAFTTITDIYVQELDKRLDAQQERVNKATEIAEKGNVEQLALEQARLDELEDKRRKAVERQQILEKAAAQAQIAVNTLLTISNIQAGAARTFAESGIAAPVTVPVTLAIISGLIASAASLFKPPGFKDGIEFFSTKKDGRVTGPGNGRSDSVPAWLSNGERVVDAETNSKLNGIPNALLPKAVQALEILKYPFVTVPQPGSSVPYKELTGIKDELTELRKSFESLKIETKVDMDGFTQRVIKRVDNVIRRKIIKG